MWLAKLALGAAALYAAVVLVAYLLQNWLVFPASLAGGAPVLPAEARHLEIETADGETVVLTTIPAQRGATSDRPLLLGFGGNAWNADAVALLLHRAFPDSDVASMHYRGYAPSSGRAGAKALFEDAPLAFDRLTSDRPDTGVAVVGFSIGASVAVELAARRPVRGLVLVTPFDSLRELAAGHYPWLPVRLLLRHKMPTANTLAGLDVPAAIITAARDTIVPASRSEPVRRAARDLRFDVVLDGVGHNDIYATAEFASALREAVSAVLQNDRAGGDIAPGSALP